MRELLDCLVMASDAYTLRGIWNAALTGLLSYCALPVGFSRRSLPTVRVSCPARTGWRRQIAELRWLVAFDVVTIRHTSLPALESVSEIEQTVEVSAAAAPRRCI